MTATPRGGWPEGWPPPVEDPSLPPGLVVICDPDTQEVLGAVVFDDDERWHAASGKVVEHLLRYPTAIVTTHPPMPWRRETPIYAEVVDVLGDEPVGVAGRVAVDPVSGVMTMDSGLEWVEVDAQR